MSAAEIGPRQFDARIRIPRCCLLAGNALGPSLTADYVNRAREFAEAGGRLVVAPNRFFTMTQVGRTRYSADGYIVSVIGKTLVAEWCSLIPGNPSGAAMVAYCGRCVQHLCDDLADIG
jgi:hypothetical protein